MLRGGLWAGAVHQANGGKKDLQEGRGGEDPSGDTKGASKGRTGYGGGLMHGFSGGR